MSRGYVVVQLELVVLAARRATMLSGIPVRAGLRRLAVLISVNQNRDGTGAWAARHAVDRDDGLVLVTDGR